MNIAGKEQYTGKRKYMARGLEKKGVSKPAQMISQDDLPPRKCGTNACIPEPIGKSKIVENIIEKSF
jgi:hypothetical protein